MDNGCIKSFIAIPVHVKLLLAIKIKSIGTKHAAKLWSGYHLSNLKIENLHVIIMNYINEMDIIINL